MHSSPVSELMPYCSEKPVQTVVVAHKHSSLQQAREHELEPELTPMGCDDFAIHFAGILLLKVGRNYTKAVS